MPMMFEIGRPDMSNGVNLLHEFRIQVIMVAFIRLPRRQGLSDVTKSRAPGDRHVGRKFSKPEIQFTEQNAR